MKMDERVKSVLHPLAMVALFLERVERRFRSLHK
jgi:hypothetical protein